MDDHELLGQLLDREAVIEACYRYSAAVDATTRDQSDATFAAYAATITEDCVVDYGPFGRFESRDEWLAFARGLATRAGLSQHLYGNFFVEIDGDTAHATFNAQALHFWADRPPSEQLLLATAIFDNRLRRTADGWRLTQVRPDIQFVHDPGGGALRMFPSGATAGPAAVTPAPGPPG
ncbi:MAG TPA: nuclear transport factor 2 family protein [Acidimicrobiia bacterium]|nr:nuclear transport factor 2 family protein [Acidimicrobiia bacterium]